MVRAAWLVSTSADHLRALPSTLVPSVGGTIVLLVIQALNVYRPQGMTRYGQRKQRELRTALQRDTPHEPREPSPT